MKNIARLFFLAIACLFIGESGRAQDYVYATGSPSFGVNFPIENGFINISNGNLHMEFSLAAHKQRGALKLNERLVYDSRIWMIGHYSNYYWWPNNIPNTPNTQGGWRFIKGNETGSMSWNMVSSSVTQGCPYPPYNGQHTIITYTPVWTDASGTSHAFTATQVSDQNDCTGTYTETVNAGYATDATGYYIKDDGSGNPIVTDNDGTEVYPQVVDRFGNYWSTDANGNLIDDMGRTPVIVTQNGNVTYYDVLAPNGPINNNGTRVRYTVTTAPVGVKTWFNQVLDSGGTVNEWSGTLYPVQSIQLPDGTSYTFTYDGKVLAGDSTPHYGDLQSVTLPTGGVIHYGFEVFEDSYYNQNRWASGRKVGNDPPTTFTHSVTSWCSAGGTGCREQTIVHKPSGDETSYEQVINSGAWNTNTNVYSGAVGGTPLVSIINTYCFSSSCSGGAGAIYITQSSETTTLASSLSSQRQFVYNSPWLGKIDALKEWNFFPANAQNLPPSSTPTRETDYVYNGYDLTQVTVSDNGSQSSQATYSYTTSATATSGVPQHGTANAGGPYLQKITRWLNTGTSPVTQYGMDDTGMVTSITDPNGNPASTTSYQCSNALPYQTTNSLGQATTYGYDCNSGAITSIKDPNDLAANRLGTTYQYESTAGRLQSISYPDGGQTSYSYPSSTEIDTSVLATPNPAISSQDIVDSFGRPSQHIQAGVSTETSYDTSGRVYCTTNPHFTSSSSSTDGSTCITSYDGLNRPLTQSQSDGPSTISWQYNVNTTTSTDEAGNSWQRSSDAFGNLTNVVEPGNLKTTYQYNARGNLTCIDQWETNIPGSPCTSSHTRAFVFDSLSRMITAMTPEQGTICYGVWSSGNCINGYDLNGNLLHKTDARSVTVDYTYDALNRIYQRQSSGGSGIPGFNYAYRYDLASFGGFTATNPIGRLVFATNNVNADVHRSYDPLGRVVHQEGCTPQSCYSGANPISAGYDAAGHLKQLIYPDGRTISQPFNSNGDLTAVNYASWNGNGKTYSYLSNTSYDPTGHLVGATMGNGIGIASQYNSRQRIGILGYGTPSQLLWGKGYQWYPNGNLQSVTDAFTGVQRQFGYDNLNRQTAAQDILASGPIANPTPFSTGVGPTAPLSPGSTTPAPQWTDPDDSNMLINADTPGASGWVNGNVSFANNLQAPDGTLTASSFTANAGSSGSFISARAMNQYLYDNETMTGSVWLRAPNGTQTVNIYLVELGSAGYDIPASKSVTVTSTWQQFQLSGQYHYGHDTILFQIGGASSVTSNQTIQLWGTKLEDTGTSGRTVTNFLPYSQRLTASTWGFQNGSAVDNSAIAPDGTQTAATVTANNNSSGGWFVDTVQNPAPYSGLPVTGSVWLRSATGQPQQVLLTLIDVSAQTGYSTLGLTTVTITNDWQRFQVTGTNANTLTTLLLQIGGGSTFTNGQTFQVWGAQVELGSTASPYVATGANPVSIGTNLTNILPYSQQPNAPSWSGTYNFSGVTNAVVAPDGTQTGYEATALDSTGWLTNDVANPALYNNATLTGSVFLRSPSGSGSITLYLIGWNASGWALFQSQSINLSSNWQRFTLTGQAPNGMTRLFMQIGANITSGQKIDVWGSQMELASSAGPYVATSALPVLRGQEMTNVLPSSQQLSGPSWGIGNATVSANSTTAPDGTQTAAALTATANAFVIDNAPNPSLYDQQTVTGSVYLKVPNGTLNTSIYIINVGEAGWSIAAQVPVTVTTSWQRFSVTGTNQNGLTQLGLQIGGGSSFTTGNSLQIWGAQMVIGTSAAPYSPTPSSGGAINIVTGQPATLVTNGLSQTYQYDSFGNILQNGSFNDNYTNNNQLIGYAYDLSGNLLSNGLTAFSWDAEGRMQTGGGATYIYDAEGNRVSVRGAGITDTVYFGGVPIARYSAGAWTDLIYGPQGIIAEVAGSENADPVYRLTDHLGSSIGQVGSNGILANPMDYTPFGQLLFGSTNDPNQFTGLERDQETGLDHATFRQYSSTMGRWMAPDPYLGSMNLADPQSLNRYAYVGNSPLTAIDPSGLDGTKPGVGGTIGGCLGAAASEGGNVIADIQCGAALLSHILGLFSKPQCHACDHPRPNSSPGGTIWDEHGGFHAKPYSSIAAMIGDVGGWYPAGCEFGACGFRDTHGNTSTMDNYLYTSNLPLPPVVLVARGGTRSKLARGSGLPNCYGLAFDTIANDLGPSPSIYSLLPGVQESLGHASEVMASRAAFYSARATSYRLLMASSRALARASWVSAVVVGDAVLVDAIHTEVTQPCSVP